MSFIPSHIQHAFLDELLLARGNETPRSLNMYTLVINYTRSPQGQQVNSP